MESLFTIVHEDDGLLVVSKPAGLVCHPTKNGEWSSLIGRVRLYLGHAEGRLVNRLDRETSGLVLIAKNGDVAGELGRLFGRGEVRKTYQAIVHGHLAQAELEIVAPLGKDETSEVVIKDRVRPDGAAAVTHVRAVRRFTRGLLSFSLVEVTPGSGRKHQIRIHLAHAGYPVVGDKLYGPDEQIYLRLVRDEITPEDWRRLHLRHHALHAAAIAFVWRGRSWHLEAPASEEFETFASGGADTVNNR